MGKDLTNRVASLAVFVLVGALQGFGSSNLQSVSPHNQFNFQPKGSRAVAGHKLSALQNPELNQHRAGQIGALAPSNQNQTGNSPHARLARRHTTNPPVGKIGFVSATQIPAGGGAYYPALPGDFNGDGNLDLVTANSSSNSLGWFYSCRCQSSICLCMFNPYESAQ